MNTRDQPHVTCNATVANGKKFVFRIRSNDIEQYEISIGKYNVMINGQIYGHYRFMREGVYVVFVLQKPNGKYVYILCKFILYDDVYTFRKLHLLLSLILSDFMYCGWLFTFVSFARGRIYFLYI